MAEIANFAANHQYWAGVREKKAAEQADAEFKSYVSSIPLPHQRSQQAAQPAEGGQAQQAMEPPTVADMTGYLSDLIGAHQKFNRPVPKELLDSAYSYMQNAKSNGYHDALIEMSKGNPRGAEEVFNRTGLGRVAILDFKPIKTNIGGMEQDSYQATYQHIDDNGQPLGRPVKADVVKELYNQLDLEKRFKMALEGHKAVSDRIKADADSTKASAETHRVRSEGGDKPTDLMKNTEYIKKNIPGIDDKEALAIAQGKSDRFSASQPDIFGGITITNATTGEAWKLDKNGNQVGYSQAKGGSYKKAEELPPPSQPKPHFVFKDGKLIPNK